MAGCNAKEGKTEDPASLATDSAGGRMARHRRHPTHENARTGDHPGPGVGLCGSARTYSDLPALVSFFRSRSSSSGSPSGKSRPVRPSMLSWLLAKKYFSFQPSPFSAS